MLGALTLLLTGASAHAQTRQPAADQLAITAKPDPVSPADVAVVTATGTVGRRGDADATTLPIDMHAGTVIVTALPRTRRCPRSAPSADASHTDYDNVYAASYSETLAISDAFDVARELRLCAYLTAKRLTPAGVRTVTVARATATVTGANREDASAGNDDVGLIFGGILAWILVIGFIAAIGACCRWLFGGSRPAPASRPGPPQPALATSHHVTPAQPTAIPAGAPPPTRLTALRDVAPRAHAERRRRRAKPRDVVLDAVEAIADTYRDRLQNILEHQDGPDWLDALNARRDASMTRDGRRAPRPYEALEPRAVLTCLAYDPVGLQLISAAATTKAKQLSGLVNEAHHPRPHAPLTEHDGYRAWQLYTDITGHVPVGDPFEH